MSRRAGVPAWLAAVVLGAAVRIHLYLSQGAPAWLWLPILDGQEYLRRSAAGWKEIFAPSAPPFGSFSYPGILRLLGVEARGDVSVVFAFQHVLGMVNVVLLYALLRRIARPWIAGTVAALWSAVPIFAYWERQVSPATLAVTLALALLLALGSEARRPLATGAIGGLAATLSPVWTWPLLLALLAHSHWTTARRRSAAALKTAAAFLVLAAPMLIVGLRSHAPPTLSWESGLDAYIGHAPGASGTFRREAPVRWVGYSEFISEIRDTEGRQVSPAEGGRIWAARARREALSHPGRTLALEMKKIALALSPIESPAARSPQYALRSVGAALAALLALEWILVPAGVAGVLIGARRRKEVALLAAALLLPLVLRYVSSAGRLPLLVVLAAGGAIFAEALAARAHATRARAAIAGGAIVAAVIALGLVVRPAGTHDPSEETRVASLLAAQAGSRALALERGQQAVALDERNVAARIQFASMLVGEGVYPQAAEQLRAALAVDSTNVAAGLGLASVEQRLANHAEAARLFRLALAKRPNDPQIWNDLGSSYLQLGAADSALACFSRALEIFPGYDVARRNLATVQGAAAATASLLDVVLPAGAGEPERTAFAEALAALNRGDTRPAEALVATLPEAPAPGDMRRAYLSGLIAHRRGENREAARLLEQCYGAARGNALLAFQLAPIERQIGRLDIAIAVLEEAVRAHPQETSLIQMLQQYRADAQQ